MISNNLHSLEKMESTGETVEVRAADGVDSYPLVTIAKLTIYDQSLFESRSPLVVAEYPLKHIDMVIKLNTSTPINFRINYLNIEIREGRTTLDTLLAIAAFVGAHQTLELLFQYCHHLCKFCLILKPEYVDFIPLYIYSLLDTTSSIHRDVIYVYLREKILQTNVLKGAAMYVASNIPHDRRYLLTNVHTFSQDHELTKKFEDFRKILATINLSEIPFRYQRQSYEKLLALNGENKPMKINYSDGDVVLIHRSDKTRTVTIKCSDMDKSTHQYSLTFTAEIDRLLGPTNITGLFDYLSEYWEYAIFTTVLTGTYSVLGGLFTPRPIHESRSNYFDANYRTLRSGSTEGSTNVCWYQGQKYKVVYNDSWWNVLIKLDDYTMGEAPAIIVSREHIIRTDRDELE